VSFVAEFAAWLILIFGDVVLSPVSVEQEFLPQHLTILPRRATLSFPIFTYAVGKKVRTRSYEQAMKRYGEITYFFFDRHIQVSVLKRYFCQLPCF